MTRKIRELLNGKKGGQFYTPQRVVKLLVEMLEPYEGRVFDPCCGSGGMFVQSEKFIKKYVGLADEEDDFNFVERFTALKIELEKQIAEEAELNRKIAENLSKIKLPQ